MKSYIKKLKTSIFIVFIILTAPNGRFVLVLCVFCPASTMMLPMKGVILENTWKTYEKTFNEIVYIPLS